MKWLVPLLWLVALQVHAHEIRPAYLELNEATPGEYSVLWKTPMRGEMRLSLMPDFSGRTEQLTPVATEETGSASIQTWTIKAVDPLRGQTVRIAGLESTMTDALVRFSFLDGTTWTQRLTPSESSSVIPVRATRWAVAGVYLKLGIEHILSGIDHLLFVLALLIITRGGWKMVKTVTAFTVSHSVTLTAATLGFVHVPQRPVEAVIALSIVFVALEIVRDHRESIACRWPWVVAFVFGLLHGLGFAGGLSEAGLPQGHIPAALLFFSLGVETGHFLFIGAAVPVITMLRRVQMPVWSRLIPPYAIGSVAMFWVIQRISMY